MMKLLHIRELASRSCLPVMQIIDFLISLQASSNFCRKISTQLMCPCKIRIRSKIKNLNSQMPLINPHQLMKKQNSTASMLMTSRARVTKKSIKRSKLRGRWPSKAERDQPLINQLSYTTPLINH